MTDRQQSFLKLYDAWVSAAERVVMIEQSGQIADDCLWDALREAEAVIDSECPFLSEIERGTERLRPFTVH